MVELKPCIATYLITDKCNNDCPPCFAPKKTGELDDSKARDTITLIKEMGFEGILLSGGEPTLRPDFDDIVKFIRSLGMGVYVDTSGDTFFDHLNVFMANVNTIGLPIDFPDKSYRNSKNLENVLKILDFLGTCEQRPRVRIGTVVTQDNLGLISDVGNVLIKHSPAIDIWKIYELTPQGLNALKNKPELEVTRDQFDRVVAPLVEQYSPYFDVVISRRDDRSRAYFMINPDGNVCLPIDDFSKNVCIKQTVGNVFDPDIMQKWQGVVSINYSRNIELTF